MSSPLKVQNWLADIERVFLDLDGTLYLGETRLKGALELVNGLRFQDIPIHFISNNTSNARSQGIDKLKRLGFQPRPEEMYSALDSTMDYLEQHQIKNIALLALPALEEEARDAGIKLWQDTNSWDAEESNDTPDAVVLAFDKSFTWSKLRWGMRHIKNGAQFIATHPDTYCPTSGLYDPDIGCLIAAFQAAECPDPIVIGKPSDLFLKSFLIKNNQVASKCALIGDRIYTDMVLANKLNMRSILTLSGEAKQIDVDNLKQTDDKIKIQNQSIGQPQLVVNSVADLSNNL